MRLLSVDSFVDCREDYETTWHVICRSNSGCLLGNKNWQFKVRQRSELPTLKLLWCNTPLVPLALFTKSMPMITCLLYFSCVYITFHYLEISVFEIVPLEAEKCYVDCFGWNIWYQNELVFKSFMYCLILTSDWKKVIKHVGKKSDCRGLCFVCSWLSLHFLLYCKCQ